jgi:hypothetical protein
VLTGGYASYSGIVSLTAAGTINPYRCTKPFPYLLKVGKQYNIDSIEIAATSAGEF